MVCNLLGCQVRVTLRYLCFCCFAFSLFCWVIVFSKANTCGNISERYLSCTSASYLSYQWALAWAPPPHFLSAWRRFCSGTLVRLVPQSTPQLRGEAIPPWRKGTFMMCLMLIGCWSTSGLSWEKKSFMGNRLALTILSALWVIFVCHFKIKKHLVGGGGSF